MENLLVRKTCSKCKRGELKDRAKRPFLLKTLLFWLPLKCYKCCYCDKRNYVFKSAFKRGNIYQFQEQNIKSIIS